MSLIYCCQGRGITRDIEVVDADGETVSIGANDKIRASIGRAGETAKLTVTSGTNTANGSSFTKGSPNRLRLDASDLEFAPGVYTLTIDMQDAVDGSEWKTVSRQCLVLEET